MEPQVFGAVLVAALLHAGWNAAVRGAADRQAAIHGVALGQALVSAALLPLVAAPAPAAWPWIVAGAGLHVGYQLCLARAYDRADLSQVYPLARGTAPLLVALVSVTALGVALTPLQGLAIAAVSLGVLLMALGGRGAAALRRAGLGYALATAGFTAAYTLVDGLGARVAGTAGGYLFWLMVLNGAAMLALGGLGGPEARRAVATAVRPRALAAGVVSLTAYWIAVWGFTRAPIALVAALRETSILFAVLIAWAVLREPVGRRRWLAALCIAAGAMLMRL